jgi:hypothetical protein
MELDVVENYKDLAAAFDELDRWVRKREQARGPVLIDFECPRCGMVVRSRHSLSTMPRCTCNDPKLTPMQWKKRQDKTYDFT